MYKIIPRSSKIHPHIHMYIYPIWNFQITWRVNASEMAWQVYWKLVDKGKKYRHYNLLTKWNSIFLAALGVCNEAWRRIEESHWNTFLLTFKDWPSNHMLILAATPCLLKEQRNSISLFEDTSNCIILFLSNTHTHIYSLLLLRGLSNKLNWGIPHFIIFLTIQTVYILVDY